MNKNKVLVLLTQTFLLMNHLIKANITAKRCRSLANQLYVNFFFQLSINLIKLLMSEIVVYLPTYRNSFNNRIRHKMNKRMNFAKSNKSDTKHIGE